MNNKILQYIKQEILPYITNVNYWIILLGFSGILSIRVNYKERIC